MNQRSASLRVVLGTLVFFAITARTGATASAEPLQLRSGTVDIVPHLPSELGPALNSIAHTGARHALLRFDRPVTDGMRSLLAESGVRLQAYLGDHAYSASLVPAGVDESALARLGTVVGVEAIQPDWKVHPLLAGGTAPSHAVVAGDAPGSAIIGAYALLHADVPLRDAASAIAARHGAVVRDLLETVNGMVIELPMAAVTALAAEDELLWIEPSLPRLSPTNAEVRTVTGAEEAQLPPYGLSGAGIGVLVYDSGAPRATHQDFAGRLVVRDGSSTHPHSTHVAGTIAGSGAASAGAYRGMAPDAVLEAYGYEWDGSGIFFYTNPGDIEADFADAIQSVGADIANASLGSSVEQSGWPCEIQGDYGVTDALIDAIVAGSPEQEPFRLVWAGGNERAGSRCDLEGFGDYYSIAPPAGAKNHITVGVLNGNDGSMTAFSSWGPTDDGRMKPDLMAPGCQSNGDFGVTSCGSSSDDEYTVLCGSSMATAAVTGCSALFLEDFRAQFAGQPDPRNSTLKVLLAQTAADRGNAGPDYQSGYGSIRIKDAIDFMRMGHFVEDEAGQGAVVEYTAEVAPGTPVFKATLAWDDPPAVPLANPALVNDLDLVLLDPSDNPHLAWTLNPLNPAAVATKSGNHRDNIEQVHVANPASGTWRIQVIGGSVPAGPQPFSVCASELDLSTGIGEPGGPAAAGPELRVYPNPFREALTVEFALATGGRAALAVYDLAGRRVRQLTTAGLAAGRQRLTWDARDDAGRAVARGVYFIELRTPAAVTHAKVIALGAHSPATP